jgi:DNA gyrase subunit A
VLGRGTAGVRLFNVDDNEHVVGAAKIEESDEEGDGEDTAEVNVPTSDEPE